jgi:putative ABC transport system permease protein
VPAIDLRVLAFAALGTLALTALLAALPAWRSGTADPQDALRSSDRGATEGQRGRAIRRMLVSAEVALSTAGLVVAALLVSSFIRLTSVDAGFARNGGFVIAMNLGGSAVPDTRAGIIVARDVMARVAALPGVTSVGVVNRLPLIGEGSNLGAFFDGVPAADRLVVDYRTVSDGYFAAMGIPLISGRLISDRDGEHPVGLVSADTAARIFPNQSPIGHRFRLGSPTSTPVEIVGVVGDVRGVSLTKAPNLTVYLPFWQTYRPGLALAVRTSGDPAPAIAPTRQILQQALPDRPAPSIQRLDELVPATVVARRFQLNVVAVFALVGLVLAAMGVYTVIAQTMAKRTRELGIRIALGAARTDVWRLVAREGLTPVTIGLACGLLAAAAVARFVQTMLFGMTAYDWPSYAGVAGLMIVTAVAACAWPARRASRIDPLTALREL